MSDQADTVCDVFSLTKQQQQQKSKEVWLSKCRDVFSSESTLFEMLWNSVALQMKEGDHDKKVIFKKTSYNQDYKVSRYLYLKLSTFNESCQKEDNTTRTAVPLAKIEPQTSL